MAIRERWQLTDSQIAALEYNPDLSWFHKDDGVLYYDVTFMLVQMAPVDDNTVADYTILLPAMEIRSRLMMDSLF